MGWLTMILGGSNTGVSLAMNNPAKEKKIPFIAIGAAGASLTGKDCYGAPPSSTVLEPGFGTLKGRHKAFTADQKMRYPACARSPVPRSTADRLRNRM